MLISEQTTTRGNTGQLGTARYVY